MPHRFSCIDFRRSLSTIDENTRQKLQKMQDEQDAKDFANMQESLSKGICSLCNKPISYSDTNSPCLHWLINPNIDIKELRKYLETEIGFFKIYSFLAWAANIEAPFFNINDTSEFDKTKRLYEGTIRYQNMEWSFCLGRSDFEGHLNKKTGESSHFHAQLKIDDKVQIKYNQTHIPYTPDDFLYFEMLKQNAVSIDASYSSGIEELSDLVEVNILQNGYVIFTNLVSYDKIYKTVVFPGMTSTQLTEIQEIFSNSDFLVHEVIDSLNNEKGYNIKYAVYCCPVENPLKKRHRK